MPQNVHIVLHSAVYANHVETFTITCPQNQGLHVLQQKIDPEGYYSVHHVILQENQSLWNYIRLVALGALVSPGQWSKFDITFPAYPKITLTMEQLGETVNQDVILEMARLVEMSWA